jgi:hypothetical protein
MDLSLSLCGFVREPASPVKRGPLALADQNATLYLPDVAEMPRI